MPCREQATPCTRQHGACAARGMASGSVLAIAAIATAAAATCPVTHPLVQSHLPTNDPPPHTHTHRAWQGLTVNLLMGSLTTWLSAEEQRSTVPAAQHKLRDEQG